MALAGLSINHLIGNNFYARKRADGNRCRLLGDLAFYNK